MKKALVLAIVLASLGATVASATTMRALSVDELAAQADLVVVGRVLHTSEVVAVDEGRLAPRTIATLSVTEVLAGALPEAPLRVVEPEGRLGPLRFAREGLSQLRRGQEVLLFLDRTAEGHRPIGHAQGAFVLRGAGGAVRLERAGDPGVLIGTTKSRDVDLDARPTLASVREAISAARGTP